MFSDAVTGDTLDTPDRHEARLEAIARLGAIDRIADPVLQGLTRVAAYVSGADGAAVHILDASHQHRIAAHNAPLEAVPRETSMCAVVVDEGEEVVCRDAGDDPRFEHSDATQGDPPAVRFYAAFPLRTQDGLVFGTLCAFDPEPIEIDRQQRELLEDLATHASTHLQLLGIAHGLDSRVTEDELTGVANRLILNDRLTHLLARQRRHDQVLVVAAVDMERFHDINDVLGNEAGDTVLRAVARRLADSVRAEDLVARVGGDEFVVAAELDPGGISPEDFAERLAGAVAEPLELADGPTLKPNATIGVAVAEPSDGVEGILARADAALYASKARVRTGSESS